MKIQKHLRRILTLAALGVTAPVLAQSVEVNALPCAEHIQIRADNAALDEVLKRVSAALGLRLELMLALPEKVSIARKDRPEALLRHLMQGRNLVLQSDPSPKCAGKEMLTTVWVLPAGEAAPPRAVTGLPAPVAQNPGELEFRPLRPERPRGTRKRMGETEWQNMKEDYKAGKAQADPDTGLPISVQPEAADAPER